MPFDGAVMASTDDEFGIHQGNPVIDLLVILPFIGYETQFGLPEKGLVSCESRGRSPDSR